MTVKHDNHAAESYLADQQLYEHASRELPKVEHFGIE